MTDRACPKCGAPIVKRWTGKSSKLPRWAYRCGSEWTGKHHVYSLTCLAGQLAAMTVRAEIAEAEVKRLRECVEARDGKAQEYQRRLKGGTDA
jgi:hypothetical protein